MIQSRSSFWSSMPPITKNIILINVVVFVAEWLGGGIFGKDWLLNLFGLWNIGSSSLANVPSFHFWQPFTYMFMHSGFWHLFCNMFAVVMFGPAIEQYWGARKYLIYYMVCGVGAAFVQELVWHFTLGMHPGVTIGASGAVFGVLLAFGWLFPEVKMFLLFVPIPIPSRIMVGLYALFELWEGVAPSAGDNVAHFAHLGGMLFGAMLILFWKSRGKMGYDNSSVRPSWWTKLKDWFSDRLSSRKKHGSKNFKGYHYQAPIKEDGSAKAKQTTVRPNNEEINSLLDKIKKYGYDALTQEEKDRLFKH